MYAKSVALAASLIAAPLLAQDDTPAIAPDRQAWLDTCEDWDEWDKPAPPYRIHGETYYVGTCGISVILVVKGDDLFLFDSGTEPGSHVVTDNITALGYDIADVKALFVSHEHFDHVGGNKFFPDAKKICHKDELPQAARWLSICASTSAVWPAMSVAPPSGTMPARYTTPLKIAASERRAPMPYRVMSLISFSTLSSIRCPPPGG